MMMMRPKKLLAVCTNEGRLFQTVWVQHENRRAAMFVDEDCVDSRSDVDDLRTRLQTTLLSITTPTSILRSAIHYFVFVM